MIVPLLWIFVNLKCGVSYLMVRSSIEYYSWPLLRASKPMIVIFDDAERGFGWLLEARDGCHVDSCEVVMLKFWGLFLCSHATGSLHLEELYSLFY